MRWIKKECIGGSETRGSADMARENTEPPSIRSMERNYGPERLQ